MNIHDAVLQPMLHSSTVIPGSRRQAEVGNFHVPLAPAQLNSAYEWSFAKIILWWNHAWNKIILGRSTDGGCSGLLF